MVDQLHDGRDHMMDNAAEVEGLHFANFDRSKFWRQKSGLLIEISKMSDAHLRNALRLLWRKGQERWVESLPSVSFCLEAGQAAWENRLDALGPSDFLITYDATSVSGTALVTEWANRLFDFDSWAEGLTL